MKKIAILLFAIVLFTGCKSNNEDKLRVGIILPLSGDASMYGKSLQQGIETALKIETVNKSNIEVIYEDSKASPKDAVSAINKLINIDNVDCVIGGMFSSTTLAIAPIAQKNHLLLLSPTGSSSEITNTGDQIFRIYPSEIEEANTLSKYFKDNRNGQQAIVIYANEDAMINVVNKLTSNLSDSVLILSKSFLSGISDFKPIISTLPNSISNIFFIGYLKDASLFLNQSVELNKKYNLIGMSTLYDEQFIKLSRNASENVVLSAPYFSKNSDDESTQIFIKNYTSLFQSTPDVWAGYGYDAINIVIRVFDEAKEKNINPNKMLEQIAIFNGVTGKTIINSDHSIQKQFNIVTVEGGEFKNIK